MLSDFSEHPCFDGRAKGRFGRMHLPVAPRCNVRCNFCDRRFDCVNESRPGVTSAILSPQQALAYVKETVAVDSRIKVVGIAGPGDPFANAEETLETLRLVREAFPDMLLCVATNGLAVAPYAKELADLKVSHVTVTVNAVDAVIAAEIYAWVRPERRPYRGLSAGHLVVERQEAAVRTIKSYGTTVKINTIAIPHVNVTHVEQVAQTVREWGADILNIIPLYPVDGTAFGNLPALSDGAVTVLRHQAERYMPQMHHCTRCRADAVGLLGETISAEQQQRLDDAAALKPNSSSEQSVAVATREGVLINQHLGEADDLWIYERTESGYQLREKRTTPVAGLGRQRWLELAALIKDCDALLVSGVGPTPEATLTDAGVRVLVTESLIDEALTALFRGQEPRSPARQFSCGATCTGTGAGCG